MSSKRPTAYQRHIAKVLALRMLGDAYDGTEMIKIVDLDKPITEDNIMVFASKQDMSRYNTNANGKYVFEKCPDNKYRSKINKDSPFCKICPVCGKEFVIRDLANDRDCCSRECSSAYLRNDARKEYLDLPNPYNTNYVGRQIPYIKVVAGKNIGRQLKDEEVVYALDGNQNNLDPKNIIVLSSISDLHKLAHTGDNRYVLVKNPDGLTYSAQPNHNINNPFIKTCEHCGKEFVVANIAELDHRFCSKSCAKQSLRDPNKNTYNELYKPGYPGAKANGNIMEHRYVMQEHLNRALLPEEVVHHNNGFKKDNRIENLTLFDNSNSHTIYHNYDSSEIKETTNDNGAKHCSVLQQVVEIHRPGYQRVCKNCGNNFYVMDKNNPRQFCSPVCRANWVNHNPQDSNILY